MTQDDLFSSTEGDKQKRIGMGRAADVQFELLQTARAIGREVAIRRGEGTTDDVGHAAGSIFKSKEFEWSGRFKNSERISNHSRLLRVWILKAR